MIGQLSPLERARMVARSGRLLAWRLSSTRARDVLLLETAVLDKIILRFENRPQEIDHHDRAELHAATKSVSRMVETSSRRPAMAVSD